ncbi:hypothetical protein SEA_STELLA_82 [Streptomyces phage Stella]|nr:hypothetical protein SEA_STELLA_82 [Streptomyces phage Stella]
MGPPQGGPLLDLLDNPGLIAVPAVVDHCRASARASARSH